MNGADQGAGRKVFQAAGFTGYLEKCRWVAVEGLDDVCGLLWHVGVSKNRGL